MIVTGGIEETLGEGEKVVVVGGIITGEKEDGWRVQGGGGGRRREERRGGQGSSRSRDRSRERRRGNDRGADPNAGGFEDWSDGDMPDGGDTIPLNLPLSSEKASAPSVVHSNVAAELASIDRQFPMMPNPQPGDFSLESQD